MGHLSYLVVFILMEMHKVISQQNSSEDVNSVLDKLIQQVSDSEPNYDDESLEPLESFYPVPIDTETEPGTRTARSGTNDDVDILKSRKSDDADKTKLKLIENFIKKYKTNEFSLEPSQFGRILSKPLKKFNKHSDVVVGELRNNKNSDALTRSDTEFENTTPLFNEMSSSTNNNMVVFQSPAKFTPKNDFQKSDIPESQQSLKEKSVLEDDEKLKKLIDAQNEVLYDRLLKEIHKRDSREENILLEKIVKILSANEPKEDEPILESRAAIPYPIPPWSSKMSGLGLLENLQGNVVSPVYLHHPVVTYNLSPRVPMTPYLPRGVNSLSRNNALQRFHLGSALINRGLSRYSFGRHLPVHYG